jgi:hypothetical protein
MTDIWAGLAKQHTQQPFATTAGQSQNQLYGSPPLPPDSIRRPGQATPDQLIPGVDPTNPAAGPGGVPRSPVATPHTPLPSPDDVLLNSINYQLGMGRGGWERDQQAAQRSLAGFGLERQRVGISQGAANRELGFLGQERGILDQMRGLADRGLTNALGQLTERAEQSRRSVKSDYTRRGAFFAPEHGAKRSDIETELQLGTEQAQIGTEKEKLGLDRQGIDINRGEGSQRDKLANAGIDLGMLGLNEQEAKTALNDAITKLGYGQYMDLDSALKAVGSGDPALAQIGEKALADAQAFLMQTQGYK